MMRDKKRSEESRSKQDKMGWKELLDFWPLSIVVPGMLILIMMANVFQW